MGLTNNQYKKLKRKYEIICRDNNIDNQLYDFDANLDKGLNYYENLKELNEKLSPLIKNENKTIAKYERLEIERNKRDNNKLEEERTRQVSELYNSKLSTQESIKPYYARLKRTIELVAKGYLNSAFIHGRGGIGKTFNILSTLNELGLKQDIDYVIFQGDISEAYLYRYLYNNNGKVIIFKDLSKLLIQLKSIDLLKAVTETTGKRVVMKANYSREQEDLPDLFEFSGRLIFEFNNLHFDGMKEDIEALFSRGEYYNMVLSLGDIRDIMDKICKDDRERETTDYLIENYRYTGINTLNLRTQQKAFRIREYAEKEGKEWKSELKMFLESEMTTTRRNLYQLIGDKAFNTKELKKLLIKSGIDGISHLRTASRRIRDYVVLNELFIVGFVTDDEEELERYMNDHRNYFVSLNPIEKINIGGENERL